MSERGKLKRKERWILLSVAGLVLLGFLYSQFLSSSSDYKKSPVEQPFPPTNTISEALIRFEDSEAFTIPLSEYAAMAALFAVGRREPHPMKWVISYRIKLIAEGQPISVAVYDAGAVGTFSIGSNYYRGGSLGAFDGFLNKMKRSSELKP